MWKFIWSGFFDHPENVFEINSCYYWLFIRRRKLQQKNQPIRKQRRYFWFHINALIGQLLVNGRFTHVISEVNRMALSVLNKSLSVWLLWITMMGHRDFKWTSTHQSIILLLFKGLFSSLWTMSVSNVWTRSRARMRLFPELLAQCSGEVFIQYSLLV